MTEPAVSLRRLTPEEKRAGMAEALTRAVTDFPELGYEGVGAFASWSQGTGDIHAGVVVQIERVGVGVIATKTYDDLHVLAMVRIR